MSELPPDTVDPPAQSEDSDSASASAPTDDRRPTETEADPEVTIESVIEAVLFASDEPVTLTKLAAIVETTGQQSRQCIQQLNERYQTNQSAFRIEQIAGGLQMLTLPCYNLWLQKLIRVRGESKLSPASIETLAIIAYKQPAIRADIEAIRGVASGEMIRGLMSKGLVKMVGRADIIGRPMQYGTTRRFLEVFGLDSLKDLPTIDELKRPPEVPAAQSGADVAESSPEPNGSEGPSRTPEPVTEG
ncbi:MAG: SMC-Scp complex subunit ScpB [Planctomycetes bacterium]|nr:SMC-Scp complex subunit ScpB [Planctomycetota bacterium]